MLEANCNLSEKLNSESDTKSLIIEHVKHHQNTIISALKTELPNSHQTPHFCITNDCVNDLYNRVCSAERMVINHYQFNTLKKKFIDFYGTVFFLIPTCILIFITSFNYVLSSVLLLESSKESGGLPILYLLKIYILLLAFTLFLQAISELIKNYCKEN